LRYTKNQFDYSYQPSVSVAIGNVVKKINIPYHAVVSVVIWDVPGREEMDLRKSYYKDVDAAIG
jgi:protein lin-28